MDKLIVRRSTAFQFAALVSNSKMLLFSLHRLNAGGMWGLRLHCWVSPWLQQRGKVAIHEVPIPSFGPAVRLPNSRRKASCGSSESRPSTGVDPVFLSGRLLRNLVGGAGSISPVVGHLVPSGDTYIVRAGRFGFCSSAWYTQPVR